MDSMIEESSDGGAVDQLDRRSLAADWDIAHAHCAGVPVPPLELTARAFTLPTVELPIRHDMEEAVRRTLAGAEISREGWEALWQGEGSPPRISDAQLEMENIFERLRLHGRLIAELARSETTAEELRPGMQHAIDRLPIWLTARVHGPQPFEADDLVRDFAELVRAHRTALLRVVREQVSEPSEIESILEEAPVPTPDRDVSPEVVGRVSGSHSQALILLARDTDKWASSPL